MFSAALLVLLALTAFNRLIGHSWLYPPAAFTALWFSGLLPLYCCGGMFYPISTTTVATYVLGSAFFTVGGLTISLLIPAVRRRIPCPGRVRLLHIKTILDVGLGLSIILMPRYIVYLTELASRSSLPNFWQRVRIGSIDASNLPGGGPFRVEASLVPIYTLFALVAYFEHDGSRNWRWRTWAWIAVALLYQLLSAARSEIMLLLVSLVAIAWIKRRRAPVRFMTLCCLAFAAVFIANQIILHKNGASTDLSLTENAPALVEGFTNYAIGGLVAFDAVVSNPLAVENTWKLYKFFVRQANKFGGASPELSQHLQFVHVSPHLMTNVYTIYFPYFVDFGFLGVAVLSLLIGAVTTVVYRFAVRLSPLGVILYCMALYGIVMSVFAEAFFLRIGSWLEGVAIVSALYYLPPVFGRSFRAVKLRLVHA